MDNSKMNRRDAIRAMMLAGAGLAASSTLAAPLRAAGVDRKSVV